MHQLGGLVSVAVVIALERFPGCMCRVAVGFDDQASVREEEVDIPSGHHDGAATVVIAATGGGFAIASGGDDSETSISGNALDRASAAALDHVGEGKVTETEVGDEESYYEVTRDGGGELDVQLDRNFDVVGQESDAGEADEQDD
jgi:hypothetical protein